MEIVKVNYTGEGIKPSDYSQKDDALISINYINSPFGDANDYIESFIYDETGILLSSNYNLENYRLGDKSNIGSSKYSSIIIDPLQDAKNNGFDRGTVNIQYNFLKNLFNSKQGIFYWIKEISPSRTELKLTSQTISGDNMKSGFEAFRSYILSKNYYTDFYLNFGLNNLILAVNAAYIEDNNDNPYILIKLYEPLPIDIDIKSTLWIVDKVAESVNYQVDIQVDAEEFLEENKLRGPNYNVKLVEKIGQTTPFYNYNTLFSSDISSSAQQLISYYEDKALSINIDFSDFNNFVHFSSATERIENFKYKIELIESYKSQIGQQQAITGNNQVISSSVEILQNNINKLIEKFDIYEYYLYYSSESFAWPKRTSTKPYELYSVTSSEAVNWIGNRDLQPSGLTTASLLFSASAYDGNNSNNLVNSIPIYVVDDPSNQPYLTFMNMVGQHFDNIWVYYKDLSNRYNATNNPRTGISLDVVADAIRNFGIELYTNTNLSDEIYYTLFGIGQSGTLLPPTGSEVINNYVTSSYETLPYDQIQKEIYKRIYHNLPYLLKTRGTERGVKALISCFGIPSDILTVNQFGGYDRFDKIGAIELNNDKITIISQSLELSQSVLSPYSTLQYFDDDNRLNSTVVEIGFSPADQLNRNISSSLGYFSIDNLVGNPSHQYLPNYPDLDRQRNTYFSAYSGSHNIWEYIRLIKYYNNSLFKMVKDFVPARATISSGIIIKPHILERSKYARHEPSGSFHAISESIDMISITASHANSYFGDTTIKKLLPTAIGYIPFTSSYGYEKYTGEFQNTDFDARSTYQFNQKEASNNPSILNSVTLSGTSQSLYFGDVITFTDKYVSGVGPISIQRSPIFQNISNAVRSKRFLDVDYSSNQVTPVNIAVIQQTISRSIVDNLATYSDPNTPYAQLQDSNYSLRSFTDPRYYGSKTNSTTYTTYTDGDESYGNTAAIDKVKRYFAHLVQISPATLTLPYRGNAQIKYLIDDNSRVIDLSKANTNIFESQNIFKSGETIDISLYEYDLTDPEIQKLSNNSTLQIYQGGFRYVPILHNLSGSHTQSFSIFPPIQITVTTTEGDEIPPIDPDIDNVSSLSNWLITWNADDPNQSDHNFIVEYTPSATMPTGNYTASVSFVWGSNQGGSTATFRNLFSLGPVVSQVVSFAPTFPSFQQFVVAGAGNYYKLTAIFYGGASSTQNWGTAITNTSGRITWIAGSYQSTLAGRSRSFINITYGSTGGGGGGGGGRTISTTTYVSTVTSSVQESCLYYVTGANYMVLRGAPAQYYEHSIIYQSTSDPFWSSSIMESVVTPFTVNPGDEIHLYNTQIGWYETEEYVVKDSFLSGSGTGSRLYMELDRDVNLATLSGSITADPIYGWATGSCRYIIVKKLPDETNIVVRYNPSQSILQQGMVYPKYIDENLRKASGNIIKSLKSDNLI